MNLPRRAPRGGELAMIWGCVALAALVMLPGLDRASLWWDECHSVHMARAVLERQPAEVLGALAHGVSPYFVLLAPIARAGQGEAWLRLPSVLAALGLVLVMAGIGRDLGGGALAWRVALATAVSPFIVWHAREVRWYTLAWLLAAVSLRYGLRAARGAGGRSLTAAIAWGLGAAMVFSPAIVLLPPILVAALGARRVREGKVPDERRASRRTLLLAGVAIALVAVAGLWLWEVLLAPALHGGAAGLGFANLGQLSPAAVAYTGVAMATGYTIGPGPIEWHREPPVMPTPPEAVLLGVGAMLAAVLVARGALVLRRLASLRVAALLVVQGTLPVAALAAAAVWTGHRYAPRHAGMIVVPLVLLGAAGTLDGGARRRWPALAAALLLALQAWSLWNLHVSPRYLREQVRDAAAYVDRVGGPEDLVLVFGGLDLPWHFYDRGRVPSRIVYPDDPATWSVGSMPEILAGYKRVMVVRGEGMRAEGEAPLLAAVEAASRPVTASRFPGLEVEVRDISGTGERP